MSEDQHVNLEGVTIAPGAPMAEALAKMDLAGTGGLALCTAEGRLVGFLTDGDVRRAVLHGIALDQPCETVANHRPIAVQAPMTSAEALKLMARRDINHLPVLDADGILVDLLLRNELATREAVEDAAARRLEGVIIDPGASITQAIERLDEAGTGALALCTEASVERILQSYTCPLFQPVAEPVYWARIEMIKRYGERAGAESMLPMRTNTSQGDNDA
ncbi:MAG: CBS domain-containing protein [Armatimonadota bacterium]